MLASAIERLERRCGRASELVIALAIWGVTFIYAWPTYHPRAESYAALCRDPFGPVTLPEPAVRLRILGPAIAWLLHLDRTAALAIPVLATLPLVWSLWRACRREVDAGAALALTLAIATTPAVLASQGSLGFQDSLANLGVVASLLLRRPALNGLAMALAMAADERAASCIPLILAWHARVRATDGTLRATAIRAASLAAPVVAWMSVGVFVWSPLGVFDRGFAFYLKAQIAWVPLGAYLALRAAWLLPVAAAIAWLRRRRWRDLAIWSLAVAAVAVPAITVHDVSRSLSRAFPCVIAAAALLAREAPADLSVLLPVTAVLQLVVPSYEQVATAVWPGHAAPWQLIQRLHERRHSGG